MYICVCVFLCIVCVCMVACRSSSHCMVCVAALVILDHAHAERQKVRKKTERKKDERGSCTRLLRVTSLASSCSFSSTPTRLASCTRKAHTNAQRIIRLEINLTVVVNGVNVNSGNSHTHTCQCQENHFSTVVGLNAYGWKREAKTSEHQLFVGCLQGLLAVRVRLLRCTQLLFHVLHNTNTRLHAM